MFNTVFCFVLGLAIAFFSDTQANTFVVDRDIVLQIPDKKFTALKADVFSYLSESWCSEIKANMLMDLIYQIQPTACVEIGAFSGSSALPVAATLKYLEKGKLYAVDAWSNDEALKHLTQNDKNTQWWSQVPMQEMKSKFLEMIKQWKLSEYCETLHMTSEQAVSRFQTIDFLHIDGNFSEEGSLQDVELYLPKVKSGGYILLSNVFNVVDEQLTKMKSLWRLMDDCDVIFEIENSNCVLFRKN